METLSPGCHGSRAHAAPLKTQPTPSPMSVSFDDDDDPLPIGTMIELSARPLVRFSEHLTIDGDEKEESSQCKPKID